MYLAIRQSGLLKCFYKPINNTKIVLLQRHVHIIKKPKHKRKISGNFDLNLNLSKNDKITIDMINDKDSQADLARKLKNLQSLTREVRKNIENEKSKMSDLLNDEHAKQENDIEIIYRHLNQTRNIEKSKTKMLPSSTNPLATNDHSNPLKIPKSIVKLIGEEILESYIPSKFNQNWSGLISHLVKENTKIFQNIPLTEVENFVKIIPPTQRYVNLGLLNELLFESNVKDSAFLFDMFLGAIATNNDHISLIIAESFYQQIVDLQLKPSMHTYGNILKLITKVSRNFMKHHSGRLRFKDFQARKNNYLEKVNHYLTEMKKFNVKPNLIIYTNILQTCIHLGDYRQAVEVFDMCKFNSIQLDTKIYNSVMLMGIKDNKLETNLDLFQEMMENNVEPDDSTYLIMCRSCSSNPKYLLKAWEFLIRYLEMNQGENLSKKVVEVMMILAAKDSDIVLSRLLFAQVFLKFKDGNGPGPEFLNLLLECYKNTRISNINKPPMMSMNEVGRNLRKNLLSVVNFENFYSAQESILKNENLMMNPDVKMNIEDLPPMLPTYNIISSKQIVEEAKAIWSFILLNYPSYINVENVSSFLKLFVYHQDNSDAFIAKFNELTYFDDEGIDFNVFQQQKQKKITFEDIEEDPLTEKHESNESGKPDQNLPEVTSISQERQTYLRVPRTNALYKLALFASKKFKNYEFMQKVWTERGKFRKTSQFANLSAAEKREQDFEFAREMMESLLAVGMVHDALNIVLSTERQFDWNFYYLRDFYVYAQNMGDDFILKRLSKVAAKHGRIRSHDFKAYNYNKKEDT